MDDLQSYFNENFIGDISDWENALKTELKLTDISTKKFKQNLDFGAWPILSRESEFGNSFVETGRSWKKASQTYFYTSKHLIQEDLDNGVRIFFFHKTNHLEMNWKELRDLFLNHKDSSEIEICLLGLDTFSGLKDGLIIFDESCSVSGRIAHDSGGNNILELASISTELIEKLTKKEKIDGIFLFLDSSFFKNISKVRAIKLLKQKIIEVLKLEIEIPIIALTSLRDWTFYERYSNILRNNISISSGLVADADIVQSTGYNFLFELVNKNDSEHQSRSLRLSRNSYHVLSLESMLGVVQNASQGSFYLDQLSESYSQNAWLKMQSLVSLSSDDKRDLIKKEATEHFNLRMSALNSRKFIMSGINDYADSKEKLDNLNFDQLPFRRTASSFENLRLRAQKIRPLPKVCIGIFGDQALLSARINFCRNYFEVLGFEVFETCDLNEIQVHQSIVVICTSDDQILSLDIELKSDQRFVAGKVKKDGLENIFVGQNIYDTLEKMIVSLEAK